MAIIVAEIINTMYGKAADGIPARLDHAEGTGWTTKATVNTEIDGRIDDWNYLSFRPGLYRLTIGSAKYFVSLGVITAFPEIEIFFRITDNEDCCYLGVALSPYSYSVCITSSADS